jgi:putative ABC transport system permease protein
MIVRELPLLLLKNLTRNRRRSLLTVLGVAVAIFVIAALGAAIAGITFPVREVGADRLLKVRENARSNALASRLPESYAFQVEEVEGVEGATGVLSDLAILGEERVHIFVRGVQPEPYRRIRNLEVSAAEWTGFADDPKAALVGHKLMEKMGWGVGDEVTIDLIELQVRIAGIIPAQGIDLENHLLVHLPYLQVAREAENQVSYLLVAPVEGSNPIQLASEIDRVMASSPVPTETGTAAAYDQAVVEDFMGFVGYLDLMRWVTVVITILGAANAIAMNVRERTAEIGILRAVGYSPRAVSTLVILESTLLAVFGGLLGMGAAKLMIGGSGGELAGLELTLAGILQGIGISLLVGVLGGLLPAVSAAKLNPVEALRRID